MSHQLQALANGETAFISADTDVAGGGRGWHLLGKLKKGGGYLTIDEMVNVGNLGQQYIKVPLVAQLGSGPNGEIIGGYVIQSPVSGKVAVAYEDKITKQLTVVSVVGEDHTIFQPREVFSFGQKLLDTHDAIGVTAGALYDGKVPFCCFRLPNHILIGGVDRVDLYLGMVDSFDGSRKLTAAATPVRFECANTVTMGLQSAVRVWTLKHTKNATMEEDEARKALDLSNKYADAFVRSAEAMLRRELTTRRFEQIIDREFGPGENPSQRANALWETKRDAIMRSWGADNLGNVRGTAWAGWNAMVEYLDWSMPVRGVGDSPVEQNTARMQRSFDAAVRLPNQNGKSIGDIKTSFRATLMAATK